MKTIDLLQADWMMVALGDATWYTLFEKSPSLSLNEAVEVRYKVNDLITHTIICYVTQILNAPNSYVYRLVHKKEDLD